MSLIPGQTGTSTKAVDGLEGPTSGSPVVFPSGFQGSAIPSTLADSDITLTNTSNTVMVMTPSEARIITLPSTSIPANYSITVINRSASFNITVNSSGGNLVAAVGLGQVTVLSTQASPTTAAHWSLSTNGAVLQGGNSFGSSMVLGTNNNFGVGFKTNGTIKGSFNAAGLLSLNNGLSVTGTTTKPGGGTWGDSSDVRLKENVVDLSVGLSTVLTLRPVSFDWKDENVSAKRPKVGFIADEVELINPMWVEEGARETIVKNGVTEEFTDIKTLSFDVSFNAYLVKAIQQLNAKLEAAEARILALENP